MEKRTQRFAEDLRLEFRSENEFQNKLAEMELLVKAQVTEEEEAEDGGNDKGKSPGKKGGKDKTRQQGRLERQDHFHNLDQVRDWMVWYCKNCWI